MINLSVSKASRLIGKTRKEIQEDIKKGILQTHEGLVTVDSINRAYPSSEIALENKKIQDKCRKNKDSAKRQLLKSIACQNEREKALLRIIESLKKENTQLKSELMDKNY